MIELETPAAAETTSAAQHVFELAFRAPWRRGPIPTALDVLERDLKALGAWHSPRLPAPAELGSTESPFAWTRPLSPAELRRQWLVSFDKHAAYLGVLGGLNLGIGDPERNDWTAVLREGTAHRPGYWRVRCHWPPPLTLLPDPLKRRADATPEVERWITTPTFELALEQGYDLEVLESWTWPRHRRVLRPFGDRCRNARAQLMAREAIDPEVYGAALRMLKHTYAPMLGGFLARTADRARDIRPPWYRPDWRHHIIAKARANLWRNLAQWQALGLQPIGIYNDALYVAADDPPAVVAENYRIPTEKSLAGYGIGPAIRLQSVVREGRLNWRQVFTAEVE